MAILIRDKWSNIKFVYTFCYEFIKHSRRETSNFCTPTKYVITTLWIRFEIKYCIHSNSHTHAPISTHLSYFEVINHKKINHLPRSIHKAYLMNLIWLRISQKMTKIIHCLCRSMQKYLTSKRPAKMIYISTLGLCWNEYGTHSNSSDRLLQQELQRNTRYPQHTLTATTTCST